MERGRREDRNGTIGPQKRKKPPQRDGIRAVARVTKALSQELSDFLASGRLHNCCFITVVGSAAFFFEMLSLLATNLLRQPQRDLWHQNDKQNNGQK